MELAAVVYGTGIYPYEERLLGRCSLYRIPIHPLVSHLWKLAPLIRRFDLVHVHTHYNSAIVVVLAKILGRPVVVQCHLERSWHEETGLSRKIYAFICTQLIAWLATSRVAVSAEAAASFGWKQGTFTEVPCGIDYASFAPRPATGLRERLFLRERFVVGHIGRFEHQKNHAFLIEVFKELKSIRPDAALVMVGSGSLMDEIRAQVAAYGVEQDVHFAGALDDVQTWYAEVFDVFCFPSRYEGLGVVLLEAQVSGLACLVSDRIPVAAFISQSIRALPLTASAKEWAEALSALPGRMPMEGLDPKFELRRSVEALVDCYQGCLPGGAAHDSH